MRMAEALDVCERWFAHNERARKRSVEMQRLASMARNGQSEEARRLMAQLELMAQLDRSPVVFDGAPLEDAVRVLVRAVTKSLTAHEDKP